MIVTPQGRVAVVAREQRTTEMVDAIVEELGGGPRHAIELFSAVGQSIESREALWCLLRENRVAFRDNLIELVTDA